MRNVLAEQKHVTWTTSIIQKSVRDFFRTKEFLQIFDGFFKKTKGFFGKGVRDFFGGGDETC